MTAGTPRVAETSAGDGVSPRGGRWFAGRRFYVVAALVCLLIAGVVSLLASSQPDGLERVAQDTGFADTARDSATSDSPLADYQVAVSDAGPSPVGTAAAGVVGVAITAAVAFGVFALVARRTPLPVTDTTATHPDT